MGGRLSRLILGLGTLVVVAACGDDEGLEPGRFRTQLEPVNDSGVSGNAAVSVFEDTVRVAIDARGATPNEVHPQRIHGLGDGQEASCPDEEQDTNRNGIVDGREAEAAYGESTADLEPFPSANSDGRVKVLLNYRAGDAKYPFDVEPERLDTLENQVVVLSGMEVKGAYRAQVPVACGTLLTSQE